MALSIELAATRDLHARVPVPAARDEAAALAETMKPDAGAAGDRRGEPAPISSPGSAN
ncbi:hypothetical protein [Micromonospora sp. NPDC005305]|uniref:hypothetical protein n=1 Tax=Micromonospora sp. NPDC005305 TaxID=3156875 RepID=UPI0033A25F2B